MEAGESDGIGWLWDVRYDTTAREKQTAILLCPGRLHLMFRFSWSLPRPHLPSSSSSFLPLPFTLPAQRIPHTFVLSTLVSFATSSNCALSN